MPGHGHIRKKSFAQYFLPGVNAVLQQVRQHFIQVGLHALKQEGIDLEFVEHDHVFALMVLRRAGVMEPRAALLEIGQLWVAGLV